MKRILLLIIFALIFKAGPLYAERGVASWYSQSDVLEVRNVRTANGEVFDDTAKTCASLSYPYNTLLKVTNIRNNKSVIVRVNDRGPHPKFNRILDLTLGAFCIIEDPDAGLCEVKVEVLK